MPARSFARRMRFCGFISDTLKHLPIRLHAGMESVSCWCPKRASRVINNPSLYKDAGEYSAVAS